MKPKKALFTGSIAFLILLLLLTGCRRFSQTRTSKPQSTEISMASEMPPSSNNSDPLDSDSSSGTSSTTASPSEQSYSSQPADSSKVNETLEQILSELKQLDSMYTNMDEVTDSDLDN